VSDPSIDISDADEADINEVLPIERASFGGDAYARNEFQALVQDPAVTFLVAKVQGRVIGYVGGMASGARGYIVSMAVEPSARRRGVGRALLDAVSRRLEEQGVATVILHVDTNNAEAIALYRGAGFAVSGTISDYYGANRPAYLMTTGGPEATLGPAV